MNSVPPSRSFLSRSLPKRPPHPQPEDPKGPFGLTTLYDPASPAIADLIFVHGLGGGSQSTWTKDLNSNLFWPKIWLPQDPGFQDVRIHSFGYNSNWSKESTLHVHDFAKSLLGAIQDCPLIPRSPSVCGIFFLVKRAYILAKQFSEFESISQRVHSIFFLATPHRGSDLAALLSRILAVCSGSRPFVEDLHRSSLATKSINDEFPHHCQDLQLFSFYETLPMNYIAGKGLVVEPDSAVLGYSNERSELVNADHREICKYLTKEDPNYLTIRNALASAIGGLRTKEIMLKQEVGKEQRQLFDHLLEISDGPEDDLIAVDLKRLRGSCQWILERKNFLSWRDSIDAGVYWIAGKPAMGKSVLSGYSIKHLRDRGTDVAFYFFNSNDKVKASITYFLRSMAWQVALIHPEILDLVVGVFEKNPQLGKADYRTLWRKLFHDTILKVKLRRPLVWIVDALDECKNGSELVTLLMKVPETSQIRILLTSRNTFANQNQQSRTTIKIICEELSEQDTKEDISLYLKSNMDSLSTIGEEARKDIVSQILQKSNGCFLWVSLVLQQLKQVHTSTDIAKILQDIPADMDELYSQILEKMSQALYGKTIAQAILTWTVCAARPLTTEELSFALQIDIKDSIHDIEKSIIATCGQLVYVDSQSRVCMVHQTARDFLLRSSTVSEFAIDRKEGHKRLSMVCLEYLMSEEMKAPRQRKLSVNNSKKERCAFVKYACGAVVEHITFVSSTDDDFLSALAAFLASLNVLSWIEYLVQNGDLSCLIQTGKALGKFLQRRSRYMSPFGKEVVLLDSWATDLVRLVTKFGKKLSASPGAIFHLIPPFCPPETAPRKQFGGASRGISVVGLSAAYWDDCLATIAIQHQQLCAIACAKDQFVIGMTTGKIILYNEITCQETRTFDHPEIVKKLQFGVEEGVLAAAGTKFITVWDTSSWQLLYTLDIAQECMALEFVDNDQILIGAAKNNCLMIWDLTTGVLSDSVNWTQDLSSQYGHSLRRPMTAAICIESSLLAVVYRGQEIMLWEIESGALYGTYSKESGAHSSPRNNSAFVTGGLVFGLGVNSHLLVASYSDGELVSFDILEGSIRDRTLAYAQNLACSPDGRTLAAGDASGTILLYDLETLKLIYRMSSDDYGVKALAFSADSFRLLDIRGSHCRVWDPTVLVRQDNLDEENSDTVSVSTAPQEMRLESQEEVSQVTSMIPHEESEGVFCGKDDGTVWLYSAESGLAIQNLFSHSHGVSIIHLSYDHTSQILSSTDSSSRVLAHNINLQGSLWQAKKTTVDQRFGVAVTQVITNTAGTRILISSNGKDVLYSVTASAFKALHSKQWAEPTIHCWLKHPINDDQIILLTAEKAQIYSWTSLEQLTAEAGLSLPSSEEFGSQLIQSANLCTNDTLFVIASKSSKDQSTTRVFFRSISSLTTNAPQLTPLKSYLPLATQIRYFIGSLHHKIIFLNHEAWICSAEPNPTGSLIVIRHFFIPSDWLSAVTELMIKVTSRGDIVFVKRHEVAFIKRGLEMSEHGPISMGQRGSSGGGGILSPLSPGRSGMGRGFPFGGSPGKLGGGRGGLLGGRRGSSGYF
ncbi:hypothetical protein BGZ60DRAFT_486586 [Tricladium varicosporioides]|nr:hypothetical protein BGZ60DRAFT_486586 [Hymenoscyphus varicosporioides]